MFGFNLSCPAEAVVFNLLRANLISFIVTGVRKRELG
jgi:hypothetical protein